MYFLCAETSASKDEIRCSYYYPDPNAIDALEILYEDENFVAVNKPHGLLVHRSPMARDARYFALQILRNQIGQHVYPAHRLDRKTSGVLLFTKSEEDNSKIQKIFRERKVQKIYHAIVRGWTDDALIIDYPLLHLGKTKESITEYETLKRFEIDVPFLQHRTSRYSLVKLMPKTGRYHQLRKHLAHVFHPIIGDRPHGCNKQNKLWKEKFSMTTMLLHASSLEFRFENKSICIESNRSDEFSRVMKILEKGGTRDITSP